MIIKTLPFNPPIITSYPEHANLFSIISNYKETLPWIYSNYIQLEYEYFENLDTTRLDFHMPMILKLCPFIKFRTISKEMALKWDEDIVNVIIDCIDMGSYFYTAVDEYYVSAYGNYNKAHKDHGILIYGYNKPRNTFEVADFFSKRKYQSSEATFVEIRNGYYNTEEEYFGIQLLKYNESASYLLDIENIIQQLTDFICGRNTSERLRMYYNPNSKVYGINVYDELINGIYLLINNGIYKRLLRNLHIVWEHKYLMCQRIQYLIDHNHLPTSGHILDDYKKIEKMALVIRNSLLKYFITKNNSNLITLISLMKKMKKKEIKIIEFMIDKLEKNAELQ